MNLFSHTSEPVKTASQPVPQAILDAVDVMGNHPVRGRISPLESVTSPQNVSPFLQSGTEVAPGTASGASGNQQHSEHGSLGQKFQTLAMGFSLADKKRTFLIIGGAAMVALIAGFIAWYFFRSSPEETTVSVGFVDDVSSTVTNPEIPTVTPPYAPDAPNYLTIDIETVTAESLRVLLSQTGANMVAANMVEPVEFLLTDKNNNPIAFSRFVYLMDIELSEELLATLGEPFSLYLYNDNGRVRIGLALMLTDLIEGGRLIAAQESALPFLFRTVLFPGASVTRQLGFRSGVYKTEPVRFVNVDVAQGVSFDYVLRDNEWFIGTSKDTLRMILDER
jgi:hypothetical protein